MLFKKSDVKTVYKNEKGPYYQSYLAYIYKVKNMREEDHNLLSSLVRLLKDDCSNLLHKKLRDEKDLVYSTELCLFCKSGMFWVVATIHKKNKE